MWISVNVFDMNKYISRVWVEPSNLIRLSNSTLQLDTILPVNSIRLNNSTHQHV